MSWEQIGEDLTFVAFFATSAGVRVSGLADVTVDVYWHSSSGITYITLDAATGEIPNSGLYYYTLDSSLVASPGRYIAIFKTANATVAQKEIPSLMLAGLAGVEYLDRSIDTAYLAAAAAEAAASTVWDEATEDHVAPGSWGEYIGQIEPLVNAAALLNQDVTAFTLSDSVGEKLNAIGPSADPLASAVPGSYIQGTAGHALGRIGRAKVEVNSPVSTSGILELTRGDDYAESEGRALEFSSTAWTDLAEASAVRLTVRRRPSAFSVGRTDDVWFTTPDVEASRVDGNGAQLVVFELTAAQTALLEVSQTARVLYAGKYDVQATIDGRTITLAVGSVKVVEDQTR